MKNRTMCIRAALLGMVVCACSFTTQRLSAQAEMRSSQVEVVPKFYFDAMSYASEHKNKSRIDVYVQVPYEELRFFKDGESFVARYEVTMSVYTAQQQLVHEHSWNVDVRLDNFAQTTSNKLYSLSQRLLEIDPGNYQVDLQVIDSESRKSARVKRAMLVTDYSKDSLSLSDIMLVSRLSTEGEKKSIVPNISGNVGQLAEGFFLFFEVYNEAHLDSVELTWRIYNAKKEKVYQNSQTEAIPAQKTQTFLKVENLNLPVGNYFMTVEATPVKSKREAGKSIEANTSRTFTVRWSDLPITITDLDKAVDQLIYIANFSEMDYIREAKDPNEKRQRFLEFWTKRDTDPQTPRNELMEEYYQRVDFANKNFSHYMEGWKTDMGMVYIRLGPPENIERHPFDNNNKPFEIWYYYQLNRQFIFVDESGFGDYRMRYPQTDLWGRIR